MEQPNQSEINTSLSQPASFWRRFFASTLDGLFIQLFNWVIFFLFTAFTKKNFLYFDTKQTEFWIEVGISGVTSAIYVLGFWVLFDGATPGKKIFGIKIVKVNGERIGLIESLVRYFGYLLSSIPLFLGYFWMLWDPEKRTWHDKLAKTKVIVTDKKPRVILAITVFALMVIGIVINFSLGLTGYLKSDEFKKDFSSINESGNVTQASKEDEERILTFVPSSCGLSIPIPKTADTLNDKQRKWVYEEISLQSKDFFILDEDIYPRRNVQGTIFLYKEADSKIGGTPSNPAFNVAYPKGFFIFCIDNTRSISLDEYKALSLANKSYNVGLREEGARWGEVELIPVKVIDKQTGAETTSHLGVTKDNTKLIWIRVFNYPGDQIAEKITQDIDLIVRNLKYRTSTSPRTIINESNTTVNSKSEVKVEINQ